MKIEPTFTVSRGRNGRTIVVIRMDCEDHETALDYINRTISFLRDYGFDGPPELTSITLSEKSLATG